MLAATPIYRDRQAPIEQRVHDLLGRLTPKEKISLMAGQTAFTTQAIERLGVPALQFSDGPNGVRSNDAEAATVFPTGSALAATWNPQLVETVGQAIGREALARDVQVMLGPNVNIQRVPLAGRNFEAYSEDPYLSGKIGIGLVKGLQSQGVGASVKHFAANEQEADRMRGSSEVDERTLREIYLLPFEMIVKEASPWTVMSSYNRVNGIHASQNARLIRILKDEWSYDGALMSDWGAVHSTAESANAGLDLEMPGLPRYFGSLLEDAVQNWQVDSGVVDEAARRMLRLIVRSGALDTRSNHGELRSERNRATAFAAASEAITLLKNEGEVLPLDADRIRSLAVIGPNADVPLYQGGGSAAVVPSRISTPLSALRAALGARVKISYAQGADNDRRPPPADARLLSPTRDRTVQGLAFVCFENSSFRGSLARRGVQTYFDTVTLLSDGKQRSARWTGYFWPTRSGVHELSLSQLGSGSLHIDDREVIPEDSTATAPPNAAAASTVERDDHGAAIRTGRIELEAGRPYRIEVRYVSFIRAFHSPLGIRQPAGTVEEAVEVARNADAALVFVGSSQSSEAEARDRSSMSLEGRQNELVAAVLAANPNTVVVLNSGAPLALPWVERAPAIVQGWLAGEEGPRAMAQVLLGDVNPSGKLPVTFPRRLEDTPAYLYYSAGRHARYGEGVFVGYRYYDKREVDPLFAFGHGLSYTSFEYKDLHVPAQSTAGTPLEVSLTVRNTGKRPGRETVQLYVGDGAVKEVVRPVKELRAFQKVNLSPGESQTLTFTLSARDLSYYDEHRGDWTVAPGPHRIYVGSSSRDIRAVAEFQSR